MEEQLGATNHTIEICSIIPILFQHNFGRIAMWSESKEINNNFFLIDIILLDYYQMTK